MKLIKATICLLIILLKTFDVVSAMDSYYSSDNRMILPKNSNNLSIKTHWQYIGYYLYKLLYGNDYFSEAAKARIDKIFGNNQRIISKLNFGEDEQFTKNMYMLDLNELSFSNEEISREEESTDEAEAQEKQEEEENGEDENSAQGIEAEGTTTDTPLSEENPNGEPTTEATMQQTTEVSSDTPLPDGMDLAATEGLADGSQPPATGDVSEAMPLYGQMGVQEATLPAGYNSMSDPNMPQQQGGALGGYNMGYGENGNAPMYNNMGAQNYDGSYPASGGQPAYGGQTYNAGMGTANNYGGMNNSYNNISDFQQNNQNMGMYQQQQQGMYQQQDGAQNPYNQMNGMSDNQYNQGEMTQGSDGMSQYGQQQQMQPYDDNSQQQQTNGVYPPDYQGQGDMEPQSSEDMQMQ